MSVSVTVLVLTSGPPFTLKTTYGSQSSRVQNVWQASDPAVEVHDELLTVTVSRAAVAPACPVEMFDEDMSLPISNGLGFECDSSMFEYNVSACTRVYI